MGKYHLVFANQAKGKHTIYECIKETKRYLFLTQPDGIYTLRVSKSTYNVKGIKNGADGYRFDIPTAIFLEKIEE